VCHQNPQAQLSSMSPELKFYVTGTRNSDNPVFAGSDSKMNFANAGWFTSGSAAMALLQQSVASIPATIVAVVLILSTPAIRNFPDKLRPTTATGGNSRSWSTLCEASRSWKSKPTAPDAARPPWSPAAPAGQDSSVVPQVSEPPSWPRGRQYRRSP